jgi:intracellular multiplication protein IcmO
LADSYGYIFRTNLGEVDFWDVVANRRILVVLLPALEKSPEELANLGKIIVACLKQMMATGLGSLLEGEYKKIIETKPTYSPTPFLCILDEYGYYAVKGAAVMPAQARSLGFCMLLTVILKYL